MLLVLQINIDFNVTCGLYKIISDSFPMEDKRFL